MHTSGAWSVLLWFGYKCFIMINTFILFCLVFCRSSTNVYLFASSRMSVLLLMRLQVRCPLAVHHPAMVPLPAVRRPLPMRCLLKPATTLLLPGPLPPIYRMVAEPVGFGGGNPRVAESVGAGGEWYAPISQHWRYLSYMLNDLDSLSIFTYFVFKWLF